MGTLSTGVIKTNVKAFHIEKWRSREVTAATSLLLLGRLAAATAAAAVADGVGGGVAVATAATAAVIDEQQNDDDQQDPVAVTTAEQITQTHVFHPLIVGGRTALVTTSHYQCMWRGRIGA